MTSQAIFKRCAEIAMQATSGTDAAEKIILEARKQRKPSKRSYGSVMAIVRAVAKKFSGVFHSSELRKEVMRHHPAATNDAISKALHNLVNKWKFLESPRPAHYKLRGEKGATNDS